jgi:hypothetical protein
MALTGGTTVRVPQRAGTQPQEGNVFSRDALQRPFDLEPRAPFGSAIGRGRSGSGRAS